MTDPIPAAGVSRRRSRLSDEQTAQRMLAAATAMVERAGLTVSLEHLSFEEVIRDAGVARSAVYRRWPYKDLFFSDLLVELARGTNPVLVEANPAAVGASVLEHLDWARTPGLRRALAGEVLRRGAADEFALFQHSAAWRTYFAVQATFQGLPDGALRERVHAALTVSEQALVEQVATAYTRMCALIGLRVRPEAGVGFDTVARAATAALRGLVLMAPVNPAITRIRVRANPFGAPAAAEWSEPALILATTVVGLTEPDPGLVWTPAHEAVVRAALTSGAWAAHRSR
ncbi:TetR/AcrR family transcriptional regulator [Nocardia terpenica]|uniref:TetR/AcrR family transcriptional regulator n=1 Tax=Nocardia terpenica TaxID=455432 RepID=A0A6G9Z3L4_9NOCA|nr:TetR/AcrR family transcriptional regulator [Nocardia terpenica]QIS20195.1 TetR/AcrR family transcriptional regulator [Nocardia terpenica]